MPVLSALCCHSVNELQGTTWIDMGAVLLLRANYAYRCFDYWPVSSNTCKPLYGISRYCNSVSEYIWNRSNTIIYIRLSKYFLNASSSLLLTNACCHCLKDYAVGDQLGHGQFATVRLARNKHTGSVFAIKIVSKVWLYTIINTKNCSLSIVLTAMIKNRKNH